MEQLQESRLAPWATALWIALRILAGGFLVLILGLSFDIPRIWLVLATAIALTALIAAVVIVAKMIGMIAHMIAFED